mgnify:CR=1 FL=1
MITVICPVYNEEHYIKNVIDFFLPAMPVEKELIIIDGGSTDKTRQIILEYMSSNSNIKILENTGRFVPFALNKAIQSSEGDPIIRLDAHTVYADDYFTSIVSAFQKTGADIVGGPMRAVGATPFQKAVAIATSTSFGIGDSSFHDENYEGYVDSVYLGAWKRSVFKDVGFFDEDMLRNQDDEFHYRAKSKGKKIYLDPRIKSYYSPRSTFSSLFKQYFQYGLFKPLVLKKVKSEMKLRHLIPSGFVLYLFLILIFCKTPLIFIPLCIYLLLDILFSFRKGGALHVSMCMLLVYPALHCSYGAGFIKGTLLLWIGTKPKI